MRKNKPKITSKNECISLRFNKRVIMVIEKYGYISLDSIVRSQYYYPSNINGFNPIKRTGKRESFKLS